MGGFLSWLVLVACVLVLVALFFPFRFRAEFEAGEHGGKVRLFFFKKKLWSGEKKWGRGKRSTRAHDDDEDSSDRDVADDDAFMPEFVATAPKKPVEKNPAPVAKKNDAPVPTPAPAPAVPETPSVKEPVSVAEAKTTETKSSPAETVQAKEAPAPEKALTGSTDSAGSATGSATEEPKEKRKLTEAEFWTILLTPELDSRAFRYVKSLLGIIFKLFNIRFENCYVEGIRADYVTMGYGAAVNAVMKGFPYLESWDIRMDWCRDKDLCTAGKIHAKTNLCRVFFLLFAAVFYVAVLFLSFWRRRAHVLKTGELPELGFVRKKIVGWMVEE